MPQETSDIESKQNAIAYRTAEPYSGEMCNDSPINLVMPGGYNTVEEGKQLFGIMSPEKPVSDSQEKLSSTMCAKLSESIKELMKSIERRCEKIELKIDGILDSEIKIN